MLLAATTGQFQSMRARLLFTELEIDFRDARMKSISNAELLIYV